MLHFKEIRQMPKHISIFGSTGSIGRSTIDVIKHAPHGTFEVLGLVSQTNVQELARQAIEMNASIAVIADETKYEELKNLLAGTRIKAGAGKSGIIEVCSLDNQLVVAAIVGSAGLFSTYHSIKAGTNIALANKESLVCAGQLIKAKCKKESVRLIPIDSEHNAIFQVFDEENRQAVSQLTLTASGGPFRKYSAADLSHITKQQALAHPTWRMGEKITIDCATLFNKGLEIIEAHYLFDVPQEQIEVVVHPESVIHSMVSYKDGSTLAQAGQPDMRTPITHALYWPKRCDSHAQLVRNLEFVKLKSLSFEVVNEEVFPSLALSRQALSMGSAALIMLNASNEVAVKAFLEGRLKFVDIFRVVRSMLEASSSHDPSSIEEIIALDEECKRKTAVFMQH
jgi:1-deoxy-D-xylulose-5-phosphate reductoisomerase